MPGNPRAAIKLAERRFPVRIRVGIPPEGLGRRHAQLTETAGGVFRGARRRARTAARDRGPTAPRDGGKITSARPSRLAAWDESSPLIRYRLGMHARRRP